MIPRLLALGFATSIVLSASSGPAVAQSRIALADTDLERFDLLQVKQAGASGRRFRLGTDQLSGESRIEKRKPRWTYSPMAGGPTVEVGALGGRKGGPKLAHVRIDWRF